MPEQESQPFSIRIFLPDGNVDGLRVIEKSHWTGCGLVCPRTVFPTAKFEEQFGRTGVYVRIGAPDDLSWFREKDAWRGVWGPPRSIQTLVFRIPRGSNDARLDLHHQPASECELDYAIARSVVEAFVASGWRPPGGGAPQLDRGDW